MLTKTGPEGVIQYEYITSGNGINQVKKITGYNGITKEYTYDDLNRLTSSAETIDGETYTFEYAYDAFSNPTTITYPSGFKTTNTYTATGYLSTVKDVTNNNTLWQANQMNALDQYTHTTSGQMDFNSDYDAYGFLKRVEKGGVFDVEYVFDVTNGNLKSTTDLKTYNPIFNDFRKEEYQYDNLNRLTVAEVDLGAISLGGEAVTYDNRGTVLSKTSLGDINPFFAGKAGQVENPYNQISSLDQDISYTGFNKPNSIVEGDYEFDLCSWARRLKKENSTYQRRNRSVQQNFCRQLRKNRRC